MLDIAKQFCPYCGEPIRLLLDESMGDAEYIEDCEVCCRPIVVACDWQEGDVSVRLRTENE